MSTSGVLSRSLSAEFWSILLTELVAQGFSKNSCLLTFCLCILIPGVGGMSQCSWLIYMGDEDPYLGPPLLMASTSLS